MLCITMEAETRTGKQCKFHCCCVCKNYRGMAMEDGKKVFLHHFSADDKMANLWENAFFLASY